MKKMIGIGAVENGFVIEIQAPLKSKEKDDSPICCESMVDKEYVAKDVLEVIKIVTETLPLLDSEYSSEEEFEKAFKEASNGS